LFGLEALPLTTDQKSAARWAWLGPTVWGAAFLVFTVASLVFAYESAMHFRGTPIDGPFQLYNALRRIGAGFRPGVDFQFFHGLGIPYAHYWLYRAFGGGFAGSELARELLATTVYCATFVVVFFAFTRSWARAFALSAAALAASYLLHMAAMLFAINGMLSLRSALPTMLPAVLLMQHRNRRAVVCGLMLGVSLFMSTEQGLAGVMAFSLVSLIGLVSESDRRASALELGAALAIAISVLLIALLMVGGFPGMRGALRYNFRIIPMDQYWYFGAPPNTFVPTWKASWRMLIAVPPIGIAVCLGVAAAAWYCWRFARSNDGLSRQRRFSLAFLAVYGVVSCASLLGVFTMVYAQPCIRVLLILGLLEASHNLVRFANRKGWRPVLGLAAFEALGVLVLCLRAFQQIDLLPTTLLGSLPHVVRDHWIGGQPFSVSGIWPETLQEGQAEINAHRGPGGKPPVIWSTYSGWLEARNGVFNPSTDYIIHALGPEGRQAYVDKFRSIQPKLVQTVRPSFTFYEGWLENMSWSFYAALLDSYRVEATTPWSLFWVRRTTPADSLQLLGMMNVPAGLDSVRFPPVFSSRDSTPILVEVEIEYQTRNPLHALPVVGATPRYLVGIQGAMNAYAVSLDPFVRRERFPVIVSPGQSPLLRFATYSLLPGAAWVPKTIRLYRRPIDAGSAPWFREVVASLQPDR
jgi:hypothetical protein